jgi:hypothetical protein
MMGKEKGGRDQYGLDKLCQSLVMVILESLDEGLVRGEGSESSAHVSIHNLQAVNVAGIDPAEPSIHTLADGCTREMAASVVLTLPWQHL